MSNAKIFVVVKVQKEGFHCWPDAPEEVDFLRSRHRHIFHLRAVKRVSHSDRDVEIIMLKRQIERWMQNEWHNFSCEMIALSAMGGFGLAECEVLEDGENGAIVYRHEDV